MDPVTDQALLFEALSDKVLHQLPPAVWKDLFLGEGRASIHFEQRQLTLVHADAALQPDEGAAWAVFRQELQRLAARYQGRLDPYVHATALVAFEDPSAAVRMAMALQRAATGLGLRVGVVSGRCALAFFRTQGRLWCTPLGAQPHRAAEVTAGAALGGILISPETYGPVQGQHQGDRMGEAAFTPDFQDSELDLSTLAYAAAPAPVPGARRFARHA
ncbi:MAG: adenylate cyclase-like protein [Ramlibacter sp.]|jgi:class 3 adenylate cyclase|uniref:hypothetical protein n=1 Tax=Ramlibacter sp. TaxID=1917967 RepID=UPI00262D2BA0|nr:hypothetical protein [Ramlibacter sp.]MDB5752778.1 adenylate cyclase-like protein [Ramlibacter sp.]